MFIYRYPNPVDCSELRKCVNEYKVDTKDKHPAFFEYLALAPKLEDPTDSKQCGKTREHFGFEETFVNDVQICQNIEQLRFERDFTFSDDFFSQGQALPAEEEDNAPKAVPELKLRAPDHSKINAFFLTAVLPFL